LRSPIHPFGLDLLALMLHFRRPDDLPGGIIDDGYSGRLGTRIKLDPQRLRLSIRLPVFEDEGEGVAPQHGSMPRTQEKARSPRLYRIKGLAILIHDEDK